MAGQTPTQKEELCFDIRARYDRNLMTPIAQYVPIGIALKDMWLEHASVRYGTANGGSLKGYLAKAADGAATSTATALMSTTGFDFNITVNTEQTAQGLNTSNFVAAGEVIVLRFSGAPLAALDDVVITATFTEGPQ